MSVPPTEPPTPQPLRDHLTIFVNGQRHTIRGGDAFTPLTDWLRYDLHLTGTKVVCAEGDCGSCTILLGKARGDTIIYFTVCGCIQYLFQLDGMHVVTIEGLKYDGALNPVQEAFVACHGAQCGFCTPGFIVSMHSLLERGPADAGAVKRALTGNLCRCTGYEPIVTAAGRVDCAKMRSIEQLFPSATMIEVMGEAIHEAVLITHGERSFFKPVTIQQAVEFRAGNPGCAIIAGGTDLGVQMNKGIRRPTAILSTAALPDWDAITVDDAQLTVAGGASLSALELALDEAIPEFGQYMEWFGSPQIRNAGTLAGNLANASPIGDMLPPLFVLDAQIVLTGAAGARSININAFYSGYRKTVMRDDELITAIHIPRPAKDEIFKLYKVSKRKDLDISTFSAAVWMRLRDGVIIDSRIAYGGVGPTVLRLPNTESQLRGKPFDEKTFAEIADTVQAEITPISDVRGSSDYRYLLASNILRRMQVELVSHGVNGNGQQDKHEGHEEHREDRRR